MTLPFLPNTDDDRRAMLEVLGLRGIEDLFREIPAEVRLRRPLDLPPGLAEAGAAGLIGALAGRNGSADKLLCFLGGGAYDHYVPAAVDHILRRGDFFSAYTPYQAEISQGTLQAIYEFQTLISDLTGMDAANASLYDGATAVAEAALLAWRVTGRRRIVVSGAANPAYRAVLKTYAGAAGLTVTEVPVGLTGDDAVGATGLDALASALGDDVAAVVVQDPNFFGVLEPVAEACDLAHARGALAVVAVNPVALGILEPPGTYGADVVVGEGQPLGCGLSFGGPYLGFMCVREGLVRQLPGRVVGATVDGRGRRGYVLTLQTREQHIRRERATSNICTNQALMALAATVYLSLLGKEGLREVATLCLEKAHYAAEGIASLPGFGLPLGGTFFNEFVVRCPVAPGAILAGLRGHGILGGIDLGGFSAGLRDCLLVCVTEQRTRQEIDMLVERLGAAA